ncbi:hypothetical protein Hrd1104_01115 [Halorhabdus sp. CBA1104]|uniref:hypothetical protein n=1 Tax=Halorhabdus sp. CBA1104 TaxID=1380432 RepID=UPI0012B2A9A1|nr:hypothetical protein [Halorhabdus sp. CBA1104]QGN06027.1 hypothetical protein Hrd1104_01115 [Halorhabdus sp. CBA1104]
MNLADLPIVGTVYESGADDRIFDGLLLVGPLVVVVIAALGRSLLTELLAVAYLVVFLGYVLYRGGDQLFSN